MKTFEYVQYITSCEQVLEMSHEQAMKKSAGNKQ